MPNQYHLHGHGHGVSIDYYPDGSGPVQQNGRLRLSYRDASRTLSFYGDQVRVAQVPDIGTIVSVTIVSSVDTGSTDFSLVVPEVAPALAVSSVEIETFGVTTMHYVSSTRSVIPSTRPIRLRRCVGSRPPVPFRCSGACQAISSPVTARV